MSRASLFTGQWMSRHGNPAFQMFKTPWAETYPGLLRTNGYFVGHVGKWHNGKFPAANFDFGRAYSGTHWITNKNGTKIHVTRKNENDTLEFLRTRPRDKPFCLTLAFFAAAKIAAPPGMQGRDLAPLYLAPQKPALRTEFFYEHAIIRNTNFIPSSEALVRKDWKYFYWPDFKVEQLFDVSADPLEETDLIADPSQQERLAEMRRRFAELKAAAR